MYKNNNCIASFSLVPMILKKCAKRKEARCGIWGPVQIHDISNWTTVLLNKIWQAEQQKSVYCCCCCCCYCCLTPNFRIYYSWVIFHFVSKVLHVGTWKMPFKHVNLWSSNLYKRFTLHKMNVSRPVLKYLSGIFKNFWRFISGSTKIAGVAFTLHVTCKYLYFNKC
jgi:hypothetical protein